MHDLYVTEICTDFGLYTADSMRLPPFVLRQRAPEKNDIV